MADNYCKCCGDGTPEYIIELNQQGAPGKRGEKGDEGYSPVVDFIADENEIKFTSTNENSITSTPNLYDFVAKKDLSNITNPTTINGVTIMSANSGMNTYVDLEGTSFIRSLGSALYLRGKDTQIDLSSNGAWLEYNGTKALLATVKNISDSRITISQGDVVKGSFTLNQSGDTTIELDTGITNPLKIEGATVENPSGGTTTYGMELGLDSNNKIYLDYTQEFNTSGGSSTIKEPIIANNTVVGIPEIRNSIAELTTLADNTEASLNVLKTDYEANKTEVAEELTTLGNQLNNKQNTLIAGNNITIVDNVISATGGTGDVTAAGDNRFTGDNTFTGKVNIAGGALTVEGLANINQATVQYLNAVNITSPGEINATSIKANGLRSDDIQTTENKKYLTEADVDNQTIQIVEGKLHANLPDLSNYVTLTTYNELLARVEALEAEINGGNA